MGSLTQNDTARCVWQCDLECRCQRTGQRTGDLKEAAPSRGAASDRYLSVTLRPDLPLGPGWPLGAIRWEAADGAGEAVGGKCPWRPVCMTKVG